MHKPDSAVVPRILLVGDFSWPWYQEACARALEGHGAIVERFSWFADFRHFVPGAPEPRYHSMWHRLQYRLHWGPTVGKVHARLVRTARAFKPDVIWLYNVHLVPPRVVARLKALLPLAVLVQYANDDPFSARAKTSLWKNFIKSIPLFDMHFAYRHSNLDGYREYGALEPHLLRAYYLPEEDYPVPAEQVPERFRCDVVFAGHYEDDGRVECLEAILHAGFQLNLFGGGWSAALAKLAPDSPLRALFPIQPVTGEDYRNAICGAKVALCFLSTLNNDTYTRRSFQIPAMGVAMLTQYTDDLASMFTPGKDAMYFKNCDEIMSALRELVSDDVLRRRIADSGRARVREIGGDVASRMAEWLLLVKAYARRDARTAEAVQ